MRRLLYFMLLLICFSCNYSASQVVDTNMGELDNFLSSLSDDQKDQVFYTIESEERTDWTYLPTYSVPREGVNFKTLSAEQKKLFLDVLKSYVSDNGYKKIEGVFGLESVLKAIEGQGSRRDSENYYITFYGNPLNEEVWAWGFEGHHLSLNFTVAKNILSIAPRFFGSNPAEVPSGPRKGFRLLKMEEDIAFDLVGSLSPEQATKAIISESTFNDIRSARKIIVEPFDNEGIKYGELKAGQQKFVDLLIDLYLDAMTPRDKAIRMAQIDKDENKDDMVFAWAGSTSELHWPHYYMIQGKTFLIELDNSQNGANHVHSVWRDFDGDFGRDLIKEHYDKSH